MCYNRIYDVSLYVKGVCQMAKLPPKKAEENTGEWLNTYADMVTLLLTFFVMLFACSNMDETKLQYIMQAFQVRGRYVNTIVAKPNPSDTSNNSNGNSNISNNQGGEGELPESFDELHQYLSEFIEENELGENVSIEVGKTSITIRFNNKILFDGDSYILKQEGRELIAKIIPGINALDRSIQTLIVSGHTAYLANPTLDPFQLSAMRAVSVESFLNVNNTVDPSKYLIYGNGPNRPIGDNSTADGKSQNRRVELIIQRKVSEDELNDPEVMRDMLLHQYNIPNDRFNPMEHEETDPGILPEGAAEKIIANINDRFSDSGVIGGVYGPGAIDDQEFIIEEDDSSSD